jgi:hypothetical protein
MNGAGAATAETQTNGHTAYGYLRGGFVLDWKEEGELAVSAELGHQFLSTDGYREILSPQNPFEAIVPHAEDSWTLAKLRLQYSRELSDELDMTASVTGVHAFDIDTDLAAQVAGCGRRP